MKISPAPPSFLPSPYCQTLPKPHTTISTTVLQFISKFIAVFSEENTTAVGTTEIRIHKLYKLLSKGPFVMGAV